MRPLLVTSTLILFACLVSACGGGNKEDSQVTETRMDDIDSLEGTISDDMINTDESTDEGPFDAPPAADAKPKAKEENSGQDKADKKDSANEDTPVNLPPNIIYD